MEQYRPLLEAVEEANSLTKKTQAEYQRCEQAFIEARENNRDAWAKRQTAVKALEEAMFEPEITVTKAEVIHEDLKTS